MWPVVLLTLFASSGVYAVNGKCRILALGGGTTRGAYEAGAVIGLINNLPAGEAQYDAVTGIGTGAVNALIMSQYAIGQEAAAATALNKFWTSFTYSQFYKDWVGWIITGLKYESGLYDSSPMKKTLTSLASGSFQRWLGAGSTDLLSGSYVWFNSTGQTKTDMITGVYASATEYGFFPIVHFKNLQLVTGHIKFSIDILHAVNYCYITKGIQMGNIIVDAVLPAGTNLTAADTSEYKTIQVTERTAEIAAFDLFMQTVENAKVSFPDITIRTQIYPSTKPPTTVYPYDYTPTQLQTLLALGQKDAKNAVAALSSQESE
mmetsp:Transcript_9012/g.8977  ORF Transcript_9012/g.8977 Transcript_9012/m.8977 type:complete len:319 (+) Transcript_9012:43-999(+)